MFESMKSAYSRYKKPGNMLKWYKVLLPSFIIGMVVGGIPEDQVGLTLVVSLLSISLVGYLASIKYRAFKEPDNQEPKLLPSHHNNDYLRDFFAGWLMFLPVIIGFTVFIILTIAILTSNTIGSVEGLNSVLTLLSLFTGLIGLVFIVGGGIFVASMFLGYLLYLPYSLTPYILATNLEVGAMEAVKLSRRTFKDNPKYKKQVTDYYLFSIFYVVGGTLLLGIPLIIFAPFNAYYEAEVHSTIVDDAGLSKKVNE